MTPTMRMLLEVTAARQHAYDVIAAFATGEDGPSVQAWGRDYFRLRAVEDYLENRLNRDRV